jgi:hypothetical protein
MDRHTFENWKRVKEALEKANKTDCLFYKRAVINIGWQARPAKITRKSARKS